MSSGTGETTAGGDGGAGTKMGPPGFITGGGGARFGPPGWITGPGIPILTSTGIAGATTGGGGGGVPPSSGNSGIGLR